MIFELGTSIGQVWIGFICLYSNGGMVGREENFVLIDFIHSSSHPQSLLFSADVTDISLETIESFFPFFDHIESKMKLRVSTKNNISDWSSL